LNKKLWTRKVKKEKLSATRQQPHCREILVEENNVLAISYFI